MAASIAAPASPRATQIAETAIGADAAHIVEYIVRLLLRLKEVVGEDDGRLARAALGSAASAVFNELVENARLD